MDAAPLQMTDAEILDHKCGQIARLMQRELAELDLDYARDRAKLISRAAYRYAVAGGLPRKNAIRISDFVYRREYREAATAYRRALAGI